MMAIKKLPREVLQDIVSYLPTKCTNRNDLLHCSQTCRSFWDAATPAVYRDINLHFDSESSDKDVIAKTERRQLGLLRSIAENPTLGSQVRTFVNDSDPYSGGRDMTQRVETEKSLLIDAAKSMKYLSKASFSTNPLGIQVVTTLPSYPELHDLTLDEFVPSRQIWTNSRAPLKSLKWKITTDENSSIVETRFLLKVVEETCPDLEVLDISFDGDRYSRRPLNKELAVPPEVINGYNSLPKSTEVKLARLRHFGFNSKDMNGHLPGDDTRTFVLEVVQKYAHSLKSITIPGCGYEWTREDLDFVLQVCTLLPDLRELNLVKANLGAGSALEPAEALRELTSSPATAKIERFSIMDIHGHFSGDIGGLFQNWKNLKFLQVGDEDNSGGPFGDDGRLQFDEYRPQILEFIKALPPTIQELYLEINGEGLWCDEDEDFDPVCDMGKEIIHSLPRLHTCDIHAWISNCDGGLGRLPEKGVFYRRLPGDPLRPKEKTIWTSRMDFIYQDEDILVEKNEELVEDEAFEGEDAKEVWLDGATFQKLSTGTGRGRPPGRPDWSWPFCRDLIQSRIDDYAMWRARR